MMCCAMTKRAELANVFDNVTMYEVSGTLYVNRCVEPFKENWVLSDQKRSAVCYGPVNAS